MNSLSIIIFNLQDHQDLWDHQECQDKVDSLGDHYLDQKDRVDQWETQEDLVQVDCPAGAASLEQWDFLAQVVVQVVLGQTGSLARQELPVSLVAMQHIVHVHLAILLYCVSDSGRWEDCCIYVKTRIKRIKFEIS